MSSLHRTSCLAALSVFTCLVAASSAFAQRDSTGVVGRPGAPAPQLPITVRPAPQLPITVTPAPAAAAQKRGEVLAADAQQGLLTIKTKAGRLMQIRAVGSAGVGDRSTIPAQVMTVSPGVLQRLQAQAFCRDLAGWLNMPPPPIEGFPYTFPDMGPEWTCQAVAVTNQATGRPDWSLGFSCDCEPQFPL